ncbi:MAG: hypothetical protein HW400_688 [Candidatus Levybacteria bacterium]|nr:hypothetical protein [Candidatus Levybacteria bacterium]
MNSKKIDKLITISYKGSNLDQKKVNKITSLISKSDLKKYINGLKLVESKKSLIISSPGNDQDLRKFGKIFPNRKIVFQKDPTLLLGVRIADNDLVYDFTLKNSLDRIINYIEQSYD